MQGCGSWKVGACIDSIHGRNPVSRSQAAVPTSAMASKIGPYLPAAFFNYKAPEAQVGLLSCMDACLGFRSTEPECMRGSCTGPKETLGPSVPHFHRASTRPSVGRRPKIARSQRCLSTPMAPITTSNCALDP